MPSINPINECVRDFWSLLLLSPIIPVIIATGTSIRATAGIKNNSTAAPIPVPSAMAPIVLFPLVLSLAVALPCRASLRSSILSKCFCSLEGLRRCGVVIDVVSGGCTKVKTGAPDATGWRGAAADQAIMQVFSASRQSSSIFFMAAVWKKASNLLAAMQGITGKYIVIFCC